MSLQYSLRICLCEGVDFGSRLLAPGVEKMMSGSIRKDDSFFFGDSLVTIRDESPLIVLQMLMCRDPGCFQELCRISRKVMAWSTVEKEERIGRQLVIRTKRVFVSLDGTNHLLIFPTNGFSLYI